MLQAQVTINLVFYSSTITMMHVPVNIRNYTSLYMINSSSNIFFCNKTEL